MFGKLKKWWQGEFIEVKILDCLHEDDGYLGGAKYMLVKMPDNQRKYVEGHLGKRGEFIKINTWQVYNCPPF